MQRITGIAFFVGLLFFVPFVFLIKEQLVPPPRPSPALAVSAAQPALPVVSINYATGATEIHDLKIGDKYFDNRSVTILKLTPDIADLQFAYRSAGQPSSVTFLAPVGASVFLLIDSDHGGAAGQKGLRQLHQWLRRSGWTRLPDDTQIEPANKRAFLAVYRRDFNSLTRQSIAGVGTSGVVVASRQLVLADAAFTAALHPPPPTAPLAASPSLFNMLLHNPMGWFILFFALLIGSSLIYQILVFTGLASGRQAQWARTLEESRANAGWRIALIPIDDDGTIIRQMGSGMNAFFAVGGLAFIGCVACLLAGKGQLGVELLAGAVVIVVVTLILRAMQVRRNIGGWQITPAHCLDREVRQVMIRGNRGRPRFRWLCRIVCEFNHVGQTYRVTPVIRMSALGVGEKYFGSEQAAQDFINSAIDAGGKCQLRVNLDNPRETALFSSMN